MSIREEGCLEFISRTRLEKAATVVTIYKSRGMRMPLFMLQTNLVKSGHVH